MIELTDVLKDEVVIAVNKAAKETPSQLQFPTYLMNFPFSLDTSEPNNAWMEELNPNDLKVDKEKAYRQFMDLYNFMAGSALVYLLPSHGSYQDQVYVANLGIYLPHIKVSNNVVLANFTSRPRQGEEKEGKPFFHSMNYNAYDCPYKWEGEADLKFLHDNVYIGGYGMRSDIKAYDWMEDKFNMEIIKVEMVDEYLYHLDCSVFPLNNTKTLICTDLYDPEEISEIEKYTEIVPISEEDALSGIANSVRLGNTILCSSNISELSKKDDLYFEELRKITALEKICVNEGLEPAFFNLSEYMKSGALLSCMVLNLNYVDYKKSLL